MIEVLQKISLFEVALLSLSINLLLYVFSIGCYCLADKFSKRKTLQQERQAFTYADFRTSLLVLCCNALVFIIGVQIWRVNIISVNENTGVAQIVLEVVVLILAMDFLMYIFHRAAHLPFFIGSFMVVITIMNLPMPSVYLLCTRWKPLALGLLLFLFCGYILFQQSQSQFML